MDRTTRWDPGCITDLLTESAKIALRHYDAPDTTIKSDKSLVTQADNEIEAYLESKLEDPDNGSYIIGEETIHTHGESYVERAMSEVAWIIDPIDGTAPYAHHIPTWGISIARMEAGVISDGAIYLPVTDELFITNGNTVEYGPIAGKRSMLPAALSPEKPLSSERKSSRMIALTQGITKGRGIDVVNPVQALGCAVFPLTYLLLQRYIAYVGTVKLWDCAGVLPMLTRCGFVSVLANGTTVGTEVTDEIYHLSSPDEDRWKLRDLLVCAETKEMIDYVVDAIAP